MMDMKRALSSWRSGAYNIFTPMNITDTESSLSH